MSMTFTEKESTTKGGLQARVEEKVVYFSNVFSLKSLWSNITWR